MILQPGVICYKYIFKHLGTDCFTLLRACFATKFYQLIELMLLSMSVINIYQEII